MKISEITSCIESQAPLSLQESYDNAGLLVGNPQDETDNALITLDVTEAVIEEAIAGGFRLIIAHHPLIFGGIKKINSQTETGRCLLRAIRNRIAIYAAHTNLDNISGGVNSMICRKLGLNDCRILSPARGQMKKLVTFIPTAQSQSVQEALFRAGAGHIGHYDSCGFSTDGTGSFRGDESARPFAGQSGQFHKEKEVRFETIFPAHRQQQVVHALLETHPYEEVAYDLYTLDNAHPLAGSGMIGFLPQKTEEKIFLESLKETFGIPVIRHSKLTGRKIEKVAVCGGSGSFLIRQALQSGANIFLTGDLKYHQYFEAEGRIILADIGHFESEQYTKELFSELLIKKFPKFAVRLSEINTNPVYYL